MTIIRTTINSISAIAFLTTVALLAWTVLSAQLPELREASDTIRCMIGVPAEDSDCVADKIGALEDARRKTELERDRLAAQIQEQKRREQELDQLSAKVQNFNLFQTKKLTFGTVSTGAKFTSVLKPEAWSDSWCYLERTHKGLQRHITLGNRVPKKAVAWKPISSTALEDAGLTQAMLQKAKDACQFPEDTA
ncbi:hypothetical protein [Stappia stellulata]|uniref:hypothetical protein n=1 Tax=Stappia stellulata TaxID=71235 RepID=UPI00040F68C4|nr:hypothetical protein [Stappia stellulata]